MTIIMLKTDGICESDLKLITFPCNTSKTCVSKEKRAKFYIRPVISNVAAPAGHCRPSISFASLFPVRNPVKYYAPRRRHDPPPPPPPRGHRRGLPRRHGRRGLLFVLLRLQPDPPRHRPRGVRARVHRHRRARPHSRRPPLRPLRHQVSSRSPGSPSGRSPAVAF
jgi:hypothetical protein